MIPNNVCESVYMVKARTLIIWIDRNFIRYYLRYSANLKCSRKKKMDSSLKVKPSQKKIMCFAQRNSTFEVKLQTLT